MNWHSLKERYKRFKRWQRQPIKYVKGEEEHRCNNCGFTFTGHYCPTCSQQASVGRIGWTSVHNSVMDIWGLGSRSVLSSVCQLLLRPGYFISDYISGKRQVSFPPIKMLFILAVAYAIIFHWLFPELKGLGYGLDYHELGFTEGEGKNIANVSKPFYDWFESHFSWSMLILSFTTIFPTWVMFRYSPLHTGHSLPEGFFIQVLFGSLQVTFFLLALPCWFFFKQMTILTLLSIVVIAYYIIGYKQLFGYGLWGTLWRLVFVFGFVYCFALLLAHVAFFMGITPNVEVHGYILPAKNFMISFHIILGVLIMLTGHLINRITTRKARGK
ncbi:MAG: DUF3667 domain-containing protein [Muribaculaceae bacterium]|nr:DUF3667 domain-containing protein [Muribaculaceae bacterium]